VVYGGSAEAFEAASPSGIILFTKVANLILNSERRTRRGKSEAGQSKQRSANPRGAAEVARTKACREKELGTKRNVE
jgi:hypothetical protein